MPGQDVEDVTLLRGSTAEEYSIWRIILFSITVSKFDVGRRKKESDLGSISE